MPRCSRRILLFCLLVACSPKRANKVVPEPWAKLGMPVDGIELVRPETDADRFLADYGGCTAGQLLVRIETALVVAGYRQTCNQFEGAVRGYTKGSATLLVKVDSIGPVQALSVGNERGSDAMLFGVCFKGYELGAPERVR